MFANQFCRPPIHLLAALARPAYYPATSAKESDLNGVGIQFQNSGNLLNSEPLDFFQDQHSAVTLVEAFQQPLDALPRLEPLADIWSTAFLLPYRNHLTGLLLA